MMQLSEAVRRVKGMQQQDIFDLRLQIAGEYPDTLRALRLVDMEDTDPRRGKGYGLVRRESKKHGFLYYVRYSHEGKMLPSKWNTGTNVREEAERFAAVHRERLVGGYLKSHETAMYNLLASFYAEGSPYLEGEERRMRPLSEECRAGYHRIITGRFIPFLKGKGINRFEGITVYALRDFQDALLKGGVKGQTVNNTLLAVRRLFTFLERKGFVMGNPCKALDSIPVRQSDQVARGCYPVEKLKGVFKGEWPSRDAYMLCLLIYTTGMRNSEIERIRLEDVATIDGCHFIDIKQSKTPNGIRLVPLHDFVFGKLQEYGRPMDSAVKSDASCYTMANKALARQLGVSDGYLETEHITFYSGRHFWKTLMNGEGLGDDAEELFMGHRVSGDVSKRYNHRDKQGSQRMVDKAKQVFAILDRMIF